MLHAAIASTRKWLLQSGAIVQVAGVYVRAQYRDLTRDEFNRLAAVLEGHFAKTSRNFFPKGYELLIDVEESSLKSRLKIVGAFLAGLYGVLTTYPDFKVGVEEAYKDATHYGTTIFEEFKNLTGITDEEVEYSRPVPNGIRALHRLVCNIDRLLARDIPNQERHSILQQVYRDLRNLEHHGLSDEELKVVYACLPVDDAPGLPASPDDVAIWDRRRRRHEPVRVAGGQAPRLGDERRPRLQYRSTIVL